MLGRFSCPSFSPRLVAAQDRGGGGAHRAGVPGGHKLKGARVPNRELRRGTVTGEDGNAALRRGYRLSF